MKGFVKDPEATLDYSVDWGPWLDGDLISTSNWTIDSPLTIISASDSVNDTDTITTVYVSGGVAGEEYELKNTITTDGGRTDERTLKIRVRER